MLALPSATIADIPLILRLIGRHTGPALAQSG
jgi:hypothetical protein